MTSDHKAEYDYEVHVARTQIYTVAVKAHDEKEAQIKAEEVLYSGDVEWELGEVNDMGVLLVARVKAPGEARS